MTRGTRNDAPELELLLDQMDPSIELGNGAFDRGYQSRKNAQLIEDRGGFPVIDLKKNASAKTLGHPAWRRMIHRQRTDRRRSSVDIGGDRWWRKSSVGSSGDSGR